MPSLSYVFSAISVRWLFAVQFSLCSEWLTFLSNCCASLASSNVCRRETSPFSSPHPISCPLSEHSRSLDSKCHFSFSLVRWMRHLLSVPGSPNRPMPDDASIQRQYFSPPSHWHDWIANSTVFERNKKNGKKQKKIIRFNRIRMTRRKDRKWTEKTDARKMSCAINSNHKIFR